MGPFYLGVWDFSGRSWALWRAFDGAEWVPEGLPGSAKTDEWRVKTGRWPCGLWERAPICAPPARAVDAPENVLVPAWKIEDPVLTLRWAFYGCVWSDKGHYRRNLNALSAEAKRNNAGNNTE